jgi:hypothetical protein
MLRALWRRKKGDKTKLFLPPLHPQGNPVPLFKKEDMTYLPISK